MTDESDLTELLSVKDDPHMQIMREMELRHGQQLSAMRQAYLALVLHLRGANAIDTNALARTIMDFASMNEELGEAGKQVLQTLSFGVSEIESAFNRPAPN